MELDARMYDVCRSLSKSGTLSDDAPYLRELASRLSPQDAADLYCFLRREAQRFETEWRGEFIQYFPQAEPLLPPVDDSNYWQDEVFRLVRANDLDGLRAFITRIGTSLQTFDPKSTYAECARMGYRDTLPHVPFDFYPIEGEDEEGINPIGLAKSLGHTAIAEFLQSVVDELHSRYFPAYEQGRQMQ